MKRWAKNPHNDQRDPKTFRDVAAVLIFVIIVCLVGLRLLQLL